MARGGLIVNRVHREGLHGQTVEQVAAAAGGRAGRAAGARAWRRTSPTSTCSRAGTRDRRATVDELGERAGGGAVSRRGHPGSRGMARVAAYAGLRRSGYDSARTSRAARAAHRRLGPARAEPLGSARRRAPAQQLVRQPREVGGEVPADHVAQQRPQVVGDIPRDRDAGGCARRRCRRSRRARASAPWSSARSACTRFSGVAHSAAMRPASRPLEGPSGSSSARSASRWSLSASYG